MKVGRNQVGTYSTHMLMSWSMPLIYPRRMGTPDQENSIYTSRMGDLFYGALIYGLSFPAYQRTKRLDYIVVAWALVSGALHVLIPTSANTLAKLIIAGGITTILYKAFVRE